MMIKRSAGGGLIERRCLTVCDGRPVAHLLVHTSTGDAEVTIPDLDAAEDIVRAVIEMRTELGVALVAHDISAAGRR